MGEEAAKGGCARSDDGNRRLDDGCQDTQVIWSIRGGGETVVVNYQSSYGYNCRSVMV